MKFNGNWQPTLYNSLQKFVSKFKIPNSNHRPGDQKSGFQVTGQEGFSLGTPVSLLFSLAKNSAHVWSWIKILMHECLSSELKSLNTVSQKFCMYMSPLIKFSYMYTYVYVQILFRVMENWLEMFIEHWASQWLSCFFSPCHLLMLYIMLVLILFSLLDNYNSH